MVITRLFQFLFMKEKIVQEQKEIDSHRLSITESQREHALERIRRLWSLVQQFLSSNEKWLGQFPFLYRFSYCKQR